MLRTRSCLVFTRERFAFRVTSELPVGVCYIRNERTGVRIYLTTDHLMNFAICRGRSSLIMQAEMKSLARNSSKGSICTCIPNDWIYTRNWTRETPIGKSTDGHRLSVSQLWRPAYLYALVRGRVDRLVISSAQAWKTFLSGLSLAPNVCHGTVP